MIPFWQKAVLVSLITFTAIGTICIIYGGTITCDQLHNTTDWQRVCGNALPTIPTFLFTIFIIILTGTVIYGAILLRRRLRELGEIIAKQSERPDPDPGNPHEDTKANRDEDPR